MPEAIYNTRVWREVRLRVLARDGWRCQIDGCGKDATVVDHVVPWREGGAWYDPANLRAACVGCNSSRVKRSKRVDVGVRRTSRDW